MSSVIFIVINLGACSNRRLFRKGCLVVLAMVFEVRTLVQGTFLSMDFRTFG